MPKMLIAAAFMSAAALVALPSSTSAEPAAAGGQNLAAEEMHKLGRQKIGTYTVSAIMLGEPEAGKTVKFDIKLIDAKADPKALRVWIGTDDGKGSEKATATKKTATYGADVKVPSPLPAGAKVWVEVETDAGVEKGSYAFDDHDGHKH